MQTAFQSFEIHGHRGCRGLQPENSIPAFIKAIELDVDALEMDLAISKDKKVVVSHEPFMSRRTCLDPFGNEIPLEMDRKHNLYAMTYEEIKTFDCGLKYHPDYPDQEKIKVHKPLLSDVFRCSESLNPNIKYNIEIKAKPHYDDVFTPKPKEFVRLILQVINDYKVENRTNLQSFDLRILEEIKIQAPKMNVALLIDHNEDITQKLSQLGYTPEIISPYYKLLNHNNVSVLQQNGFKVIPWTVNTRSDMKTLIGYNVNGIITDFPDKLIEMLH